MHPRNVRRVKNTYFSADSGSQNRGLLPWKAGALSVTGSALDIPAEPATGCQCLFGALCAPRTAMRILGNGYKIHVPSRIAVQMSYGRVGWPSARRTGRVAQCGPLACLRGRLDPNRPSEHRRRELVAGVLDAHQPGDQAIRTRSIRRASAGRSAADRASSVPSARARRPHLKDAACGGPTYLCVRRSTGASVPPSGARDSLRCPVPTRSRSDGQ
jgi:hypothetical protein